MASGSRHVGAADVQIKETRDIPIESIVALYRTLGWSAVEKPAALHKALVASHSLVTAWQDGRLVGLGNAISDGHLVVYYSHLLVDPEFQGMGIGTQLMRRLMAHYAGFHQQLLVADGRATGFFSKCGFKRAGKTEPMWIYAGHDH